MGFLSLLEKTWENNFATLCEDHRKAIQKPIHRYSIIILVSGILCL
jgi:hypothetical protein